MANATKHSHYHKDVAHLKTVDVYRVLSLFGVTDPCLQHAIKKLLVAGGRGAGKSIERDVREAGDSLDRFLQMRAEDDNARSNLRVCDLLNPVLFANDRGATMPDNPALTGEHVATITGDGTGVALPPIDLDAGARAVANGVDLTLTTAELSKARARMPQFAHDRSLLVAGQHAEFPNG